MEDYQSHSRRKNFEKLKFTVDRLIFRRYIINQ